MKRIFLLVSLVIFAFGNELRAQNPLSLTDVLIAENGNSLRKPLIAGTNAKLVCKLKNGDKLKGQLVVYRDFITINGTKVELDSIAFLKVQSHALLGAGIGLLASGAVREAIPEGENQVSERNQASIVTLAAFTGASLILFDSKKYKDEKGWTFRIGERDLSGRIRPSR